MDKTIVNWWKEFAQTHENLKHSIAGAGAGIVSSIVTCPLDVAKTRLQNQSIALPGEKLYKGTVGTLTRIWQEEGIRGLYRGLGPTILGYLPTWAIYFTAYDYCKNHWSGKLGHDKEWLLHISSAMSAGAASTMLTNPLWVIKTRLMTQNERTAYRYNNTLHAFFTIAREEGFRGFYKGLGPSLIGVSHVAVQFPLYERLKVLLHVERDVSTSGSTSILLASALSKMAASLATYPHEVIRTRLQNQTRKPYKYQGIVHALEIISKEEGIRGFYKGLSTNLVRTVPSSALTILTYEMVVRKLDDWKNL
ncbi:mitochondrial carrier domain-containing protein [Gilbertella persicaria]|uniref:mitochondrial carrier domain-containing protein n=1 Tax=Gilbertella persicaria TaxID=101096 RepID=UPI00221FDB13|nr:mitochondrial carrier domain-containing protein [Gilbertella persicaria]KAI8085800.1 mitochondrial carrier domain-containing protein [Gilbertella persicaria]